jgi:ankyrin repeat protein
LAPSGVAPAIQPSSSSVSDTAGPEPLPLRKRRGPVVSRASFIDDELTIRAKDRAMTRENVSTVSLAVPIAALVSHLVCGPALASPHECQELTQTYHAAKQSIADRQVNTYLAQAASKGCLTLAQELLKDGASVHARRREGDTALHHAVKASDPDVAKLLLDHGADIEQRDLAGATPLTMAIDANRSRTVVLLLDRGANPNAVGKAGSSPLAVAAFGGHERIVRLLLKQGADSNVADRTGKTAIVYAAARGFTSIVQLLLDAGVDVNVRYANDLTVLMWASGHANDVPERDALNTVELLISKGARLDDADDRGRTALMIAAELDRDAVVDLLIAKGASTTLKDRAGKSAVDLAAGENVRKKLVGH